jgi:hypothetical protein
MKRVLFTVGLLLWAATAVAQTEMRYYLVPKLQDTTSFPFPVNRAKYMFAGDLGPTWAPGAYQSMDYGAEALFLVAADLTPADHTTLTSQPDVIAIPSPIDTNVSAGALPTVQAKLEAADIPGNWVTTAHTYRQVLKAIVRAIAFNQRYNGLNAEKFFSLTDKLGNRITLDTQFNQLTAAEKTKLQNVATDLGLDTSGVVSTTTVRQILINVAGQLFPNGVPFGGDTF